MLKSGENPEKIVADKGLKQVTNVDEIEPIVEQILQDHSDNVRQYKEGNTKLLGFFVGQVMKATAGKANPKLVNQLLQEKLK